MLPAVTVSIACCGFSSLLVGVFWGFFFSALAFDQTVTVQDG